MIKLVCPSKVNILLKVLDRREDGYHNLWSIFLPLKNPCDYLYIEESTGTGLNLSCAIKELSKDNILTKAYTEFGKITGIWPGLNVVLEKNIPMGSGLGGGSSDAASLLNYLKGYLNNNEDADRIIFHVAKKCGADIPFFLKNRPAIVQGIGEKITGIEIDLKGFYIVVFCPSIGISTKWAYEELDKKRGTPDYYGLTIDTFEIKNIPHFGYRLWINDFEDVVLKVQPELLKIKAWCYRLGARACVLSGSGSSIVALFSGLDTIDVVTDFFKQRDVRVFVNKGV
ncbi:4-(cytidine 5'-diphospho)-2-C-methyl-D-erythritol kinase [Desulfothermus okinawensis JCM 13304]